MPKPIDNWGRIVPVRKKGSLIIYEFITEHRSGRRYAMQKPREGCNLSREQHGHANRSNHDSREQPVITQSRQAECGDKSPGDNRRNKNDEKPAVGLADQGDTQAQKRQRHAIPRSNHLIRGRLRLLALSLVLKSSCWAAASSALMVQILIDKNVITRSFCQRRPRPTPQPPTSSRLNFDLFYQPPTACTTRRRSRSAVAACWQLYGALPADSVRGRKPYLQR